MTSLELHGVSAGYGGTKVIHDFNLIVRPGEIVALVGANGAGKSTLVKSISGLIPICAGAITFDGVRIDPMSTAARLRLGIAHVPEGRQIFSRLTVAENLDLGAYLHQRHAGDVDGKRAEVTAYFPALKERATSVAGNLSGGQQQMLAIGRGLMARPKVLILDEPSLGLAPFIVREIFALIVRLREQGLAILLSEQNAQLSLAIADRGYVIENGTVAQTGAGRELLRSKDIAERYLGVGAKAEEGIDQRHKVIAERLRDVLMR